MAVMKNTHKEDTRSQIIHKYSLSPRTRAIVLVDLLDKEIIDFLLEASQSIWVSCILMSDIAANLISGADVFISDRKTQSIDVVSMIQHSIVPIIPIENDYPKVFSEFDPMKFEWNAFLFSETNKYLIFEKLIRYLENVRYSGDKRILLTNIAKTF